jgi:hypothetical protein
MTADAPYPLSAAERKTQGTDVPRSDREFGTPYVNVINSA